MGMYEFLYECTERLTLFPYPTTFWSWTIRDNQSWVQEPSSLVSSPRLWKWGVQQKIHNTTTYGFGGLVVSMLASDTQDRGFAPGRSRQIFSGEKILSMLSFRREVKLFAPCCRFAACQRTL
jgi:hypothetical protein